MKELGSTLLREDAFSELTIGNVALTRAMVTAGVRVITSYPGSPTPEIAEAIGAIPETLRPFRFEFSVNEKVALEVAFGAAINGHLSVVFFKSVGLNVAADSFVQLPLMDITGGMVVILGDDPGANSSQNEQDNRHYAQLSYCPVFEPASAQEAHDMFLKAGALARELRTVVILRLTTHVCHAKEKVVFSAWERKPADNSPRFDPDSSNYIPLAASVFPLKKRALARLEAIRLRGKSLGFDTLVDNQNTSCGIIVAGLPFASVMESMDGLGQAPDIYKIGMVNPLDTVSILEFLKGHREVKIIEELDPVIEREIKAAAFDAGIISKIIGKKSESEMMGEYTPSKAALILWETWPDLFPDRSARRAAAGIMTPRPPQLCPGCGHRSAFFAVKKALGKNDITVADIGCHTLGYLPPYRMGQVLLSMGHSVSTASGLALFNAGRRVVCFMGDSTFFHAGMPGIANAVYNRHDTLLIVMENGTTAMTGHQDHPGAGRNFNGDAPKLSVRSALEGLGATNIREADTYQQATLGSIVRIALAETGFRVIIARHPCMLKFMKEAKRKPGWSARRVGIDTSSCVGAMDCIERFACPSFARNLDGSISVNGELCIGDGSCRQTCQTGSIVPDSAGGKNG